MIVNHSWQTMFIVTGLVGLAWLLPWLALTGNDYPVRPAAGGGGPRRSDGSAA